MTEKYTAILYLRGEDDMLALDAMLKRIDKTAIVIKGHKRIDVRTRKSDEIIPYVRGIMTNEQD